MCIKEKLQYIQYSRRIKVKLVYKKRFLFWNLEFLESIRDDEKHEDYEINIFETKFF